MALAKKQAPKRIWRVPISNARLLWLAGSVLLCVLLIVWDIAASSRQRFPGPLIDPWRLFGIIAFLLVLGTATYSLRRRFVRSLPGKAQDWLWMHTWIGIAAVLIALLHETFAHITHDFCQNLNCFTASYWGTSALFALILLVLSGIVGRLFDAWQAHVIAYEASSNGVGIARALEERILELEYIVERLCAGKSEPFKQYCMQALESMPSTVPALSKSEHQDFQRTHETLLERTRLVQSLQRQQQARRIIRGWRSIHMILAVLALLVISFHAILELLTNVLHIFSPA